MPYIKNVVCYRDGKNKYFQKVGTFGCLIFDIWIQLLFGAQILRQNKVEKYI
jgi:hypothetical protein